MGADIVQRLAGARVAEGWMPGAAWWVESNGRVFSRGAVGQAALAPHTEPLREATPFDLASLTKPLSTALLFVLLEQNGQLVADVPVGTYLDELAGAPIGEATLLELAAHTSGLPAWHPLYLESASMDGYLAQLAALPPAHDRGRTLYSDLGYIVLGAVLERVSGEPLDVLFTRQIAEPLGLARIGYAVDPRRFADAAATERGNAYERALAGEAGAGHPWRTKIIRGLVHDANAHALGGAAGHAGLFGPVAEVARLARELLDPTTLGLSAVARGRLLEVVPGSDGRTVGWVAAAHSSAARGILPDTAPGHTGFTGTSIWLDPHDASLYVLLTNRVHPECTRRNFQLVRRAFHRCARRRVAMPPRHEGPGEV